MDYFFPIVYLPYPIPTVPFPYRNPPSPLQWSVCLVLLIAVFCTALIALLMIRQMRVNRYRSVGYGRYVEAVRQSEIDTDELGGTVAIKRGTVVSDSVGQEYCRTKRIVDSDSDRV